MLSGHQSSSGDPESQEKAVTVLITAQLQLPCSGLSFSDLLAQSGHPILRQAPDICCRMSRAAPLTLRCSAGKPEWPVHMSAFTRWTSTWCKSTLFPSAWASPDCWPA